MQTPEWKICGTIYIKEDHYAEPNENVVDMVVVMVDCIYNLFVYLLYFQLCHQPKNNRSEVTKFAGNMSIALKQIF